MVLVLLGDKLNEVLYWGMSVCIVHLEILVNILEGSSGQQKKIEMKIQTWEPVCFVVEDVEMDAVV